MLYFCEYVFALFCRFDFGTVVMFLYNYKAKLNFKKAIHKILKQNKANEHNYLLSWWHNLTKRNYSSLFLYTCEIFHERERKGEGELEGEGEIYARKMGGKHKECEIT